MTHYRKALGERRCSHRHRTIRAARECTELVDLPWTNDVVECIGGGPAGELESRVPADRLT